METFGSFLQSRVITFFVVCVTPVWVPILVFPYFCTGQESPKFTNPTPLSASERPGTRSHMLDQVLAGEPGSGPLSGLVTPHPPRDRGARPP